MDPTVKLVAVIGAGMAGLVCSKSLLEEGHSVIVFEKTSAIGGLWRYNPDPRIHSCYVGLKTNTPRDLTSFHDFPMPASFPSNPHNTQVLEYLHSYAAHFNLFDKIQFNTKVIKVSPTNEKWDVIVEKESGSREKHIFDSVAVCNGHHWLPILPTEKDIPGISSFKGTQIHSHEYRSPNDYSGEKVLVSGLGISGSDITRELESANCKLFASSRRYPVIPPEKFIPGISKYPKIEKIVGPNEVIFVGGTSVEVDHIIWCWGFRYEFPFLDLQEVPLQITSDPSRVSLYKHVFLPELPTIAFIGLPTVDGSLHPISERQCIWFARILSGRKTLPPPEKMKESIQEWSEAILKYNVKYRPMQVELRSYLVPELLEDLPKLFEKFVGNMC